MQQERKAALQRCTKGDLARVTYKQRAEAYCSITERMQSSARSCFASQNNLTREKDPRHARMLRDALPGVVSQAETALATSRGGEKPKRTSAHELTYVCGTAQCVNTGYL